MGLKKEIIETVVEFKAFWENYGPFRYALASNKFPEYILEEEQWFFSNDSSEIFMALLDWQKNKMKVVQAPFKKGAYPDNIAPYKIANFPESLADYSCSSFNHNGYLTKAVLEKSSSEEVKDVEVALFKDLEETVGDLGYDFLKPSHGSSHAYIDEYVIEWNKDEQA